MKGCEFMSLNGGYAMIKYNSTQEELQIAYRSKKPALFYDENQRAHWAVIEETATQSVDEETQEQITLYKYSYRLLDEESGGSEVHLYGHYISATAGADSNINLAIYSNSNIPFKIDTLKNWIKDNGFSVASDKSYVASGYYLNGRIVIGVGVRSSMLEVLYMYINDSNTLTKSTSEYYGFDSITDTITQIF